jgi:hypothetical protein
LHLFLDLEYRDQQLVQQDVTSGITEALNDDTEFARELNSSGQYDIFRLKENRQIRTGRLQYFDTPYFGALVLVTAIESG